MNGNTREVLMVGISEIIPNRFQPRINFDDNSMQELAQSITEHGIIQPLVVRRVSDKFEIIAGERRYKAATIAGIAEVPVIVADLNDTESAEVALIENIQRKDLSAIEEAKSYQKIIDMGQITQEILARRMGKSQSAIANKIRLLNLIMPVQEALMHDEISERHARSLLSLKNEQDQLNMLARIKNERLTVKNTDSAIADFLGTSLPESAEEVESLDLDALPTLETNKQTSPQTQLTSDFLLNPEPTSEMISPLPGSYIAPSMDIPALPTTDQVLDKTMQTINNDPMLKPEIDYGMGYPPQEGLSAIPSVMSNDYRSAINIIRETIKNLQKYDAKINSEEFDFENFFQINIKLDKK